MPGTQPRWILEHSDSLDAELAKKGLLYARNEYFTRSAYCAVHDPAAPQDEQGETADRRVRNTKDVPVVRIDYISIENMLLGMREAPHRGSVFNGRKMNRALSVTS